MSKVPLLFLLIRLKGSHLHTAPICIHVSWRKEKKIVLLFTVVCQLRIITALHIFCLMNESVINNPDTNWWNALHKDYRKARLQTSRHSKQHFSFLLHTIWYHLNLYEVNAKNELYVQWTPNNKTYFFYKHELYVQWSKYSIDSILIMYFYHESTNYKSESKFNDTFCIQIAWESITERKESEIWRKMWLVWNAAQMKDRGHIYCEQNCINQKKEFS